VIGARERDAFAWAARLAPESPLLVPGIGAQGGAAADLADALRPAQAGRVVVSISRAIIHAGDGPDFAAAARAAALLYRAQLSEALAGRVESADGAG
jgi:orotidine-5'-phosphate decarboxylase